MAPVMSNPWDLITMLIAGNITAGVHAISSDIMSAILLRDLWDENPQAAN